MTNQNCLRFFMTVGLSALCLCGQQSAKRSIVVKPELNPNLFTISVKLEQKGFRAGEPVWANVSFRNISGRELVVMVSSPLEEYKVEVFQSDGKLAPMTRAGTAWQPNKPRKTWGGPHEKRMGPHDVWETRIEVTHLYDLHVPGAYSLVISRETDEMADRWNVVAWFKAVADPVTFYIADQ